VGNTGGTGKCMILGLIDSFEPEVVEAMRTAYRMACETLQLKDAVAESTRGVSPRVPHR
jgi:hypothetical protein